MSDWYNMDNARSTFDPPLSESEGGLSAPPPFHGVGAGPLAGAEAHPEISESTDEVVNLPRGVLNRAGLLQNRATIRELVGEDEERLDRVKSPFERFDTILALGTCSVGDIDLTGLPVSERREILSGLLIGERWILFLEITKATFGNERAMTFQCPHCNSKYESTVLVDTDFPISIPDDLQMLNKYVTRTEDVVEYRLVIGADLTDIADKMGLTQAEVTSKLLSRIIIRVNGEEPLDPEEFVRQMSITDRSRLALEASENQPTVDLTLRPECTSCHEEVVLPLSWEDLFRP